MEIHFLQLLKAYARIKLKIQIQWKNKAKRQKFKFINEIIDKYEIDWFLAWIIEAIEM